MFPGDKTKLKDIFKIHHTMRIMPEDQNTGGFYVALFKKNAHVDMRNTPGNKDHETHDNEKDNVIEDQKATQKVKTNDGSNKLVSLEDTKVETIAHKQEDNPQITTIKIQNKKRERPGQVKSEYFPFVEKHMDAWQAIQEMYGLDEVFFQLL